jgi:hypothetical protein
VTQSASCGNAAGAAEASRVFCVSCLAQAVANPTRSTIGKTRFIAAESYPKGMGWVSSGLKGLETAAGDAQNRGVRGRIIAGVLLLSILGLPLLAVAQRFLFRSLGQSLPAVKYDSHFAFTRIRYGARIGQGFGGWEHDYPTADRNFSAILDYITNMRVHLDGSNILDLDDPRIFENPVIYMSEPGYWTTDDAEAARLRAYLLKGRFLIFDDFDARRWQNLVQQMKRALPDTISSG